jgi:hypothetical protein
MDQKKESVELLSISMDFTLLAAGATGRAVQKEYYFFRYGIHITCEVREKTKNHAEN